jgi:subfamily B ATP-binding cassette protein MsbA
MKKFLNKYFSSFAFFFKELKYKLFVIVVLSFSVGVLDGLGLAIFMPLLELVGNPDQVTDASRTPAHEFINTLGITITFTNVLFLMLVVFSFKGFMKFASSSYQVIVFQSFIKSLRLKMFLDFDQIKFKYFTSSDVGRIQNTFTLEVDRVSSASRFYLRGIESLVLISTYLVLAFLSNTEFTILVIIGSALTNFIYKYINKNTKKQSSELVKRNSLYQGMVIQYVNLFKYLKVSGKIDVFAKKIKKQVFSVEKTNRKIGILNALSLSLREPLMIFILAAVMFIQVSILKGSLELILLSILFFYRALQSVLAFQTQYNNFLALQGSLVNVQDFQKELVKHKETNGKHTFIPFNEAIVLRNVCFNYGSTSILSNINLTIQKNETIALVGESGSGKSTLINILCGLLPIDSGEFTIDQKNVSDLEKTSYQKNIGYITQEPIIFTDSLFNNVTFFEEKNDETLKKFYDAITKASLFDFLNQSNLKEDINLGNNGINLSGGQKQRISIARELYKNAEFLFMDEATSALDSETENFIQKNIEKIKGKKTLVVAAHRLSTIKEADRIIIMDNGSTHAVGTFNELLQTNPMFKKMIELQEI